MKNRRMEVTTSSWSCSCPRAVGGINAVFPINAALVQAVCSCAEVDVDAVPRACRASSMTRPGSFTLSADPNILEASYLNNFPAKPLQLSHKYSSICTNRIVPLHCWVTAAVAHPSPPRDSFQRLAPTEWAGDSWGHCLPLYVTILYVIGNVVLKAPHASKNKSMFYCLDEQMQPFGFGK